MHLQLLVQQIGCTPALLLCAQRLTTMTHAAEAPWACCGHPCCEQQLAVVAAGASQQQPWGPRQRGCRRRACPHLQLLHLQLQPASHPPSLLQLG